MPEIQCSKCKVPLKKEKKTDGDLLMYCPKCFQAYLIYENKDLKKQYA